MAPFTAHSITVLRRVDALRASYAGASALAGDTPTVAPLREQLWALRPILDGGVPPLDIFTPDAHPVDGRVDLPWAVTGRSGGRERGEFLGSGPDRPTATLPTRVSGDSDRLRASGRVRAAVLLSSGHSSPGDRSQRAESSGNLVQFNVLCRCAPPLCYDSPMQILVLLVGVLLFMPTLAEGTTVLIHHTSESLVFAADTLLTTGNPPKRVGDTCKVRLYTDVAFVAAGSYTDAISSPSFDVYRLAHRLLSPGDQLSVTSRVQRFVEAIAASEFFSRDPREPRPPLAGFIGAIVDGAAVLYALQSSTDPMLKRVTCEHEVPHG